MELVLSAISAGGLVGAGDQYLCLMIISIAAKTDLVKLTPQMTFMESWWFLGIVTVFWLLTIAPAYASLLSPGVMNAINTVVNFLSGFLVPASGALLALPQWPEDAPEHLTDFNDLAVWLAGGGA